MKYYMEVSSETSDMAAQLYINFIYRTLIASFTLIFSTRPFKTLDSGICGVIAMTSVFRFPLDAPALTGTLLKHGEFGLQLGKKFFILYPGFLVFYDNAEKWKLDVKGDTLSVSASRFFIFIFIYLFMTGWLRAWRRYSSSIQGRSGAVYLKSSEVGKTAPGATKYRYTFSVTAPDVRNKRK